MLIQGGKVFIIALAIVLAGFFVPQKLKIFQPNEVRAVESSKALINEIQIYPTEKRFIELYNPNDFSLDLTGWYLQRKTQTASSFSSLVSKTYFAGKVIGANSYFLISRGSLENADIILGSLTLTEANTIQLKDASGEIIDKVGWGEVSDCEGACAGYPAENQNLERKLPNGVFLDTDNNAEDFIIQTCPSPKAPAAACQIENGEQDNSGNNTATSTSAPADNNTASSTEQNATPLNPPLSGGQKINFGDVIVNELVSDPADEEVEWIELYNKTSQEIDLNGWRLEDGSKAKTSLSGSLGLSGENRYKVIDKPAGNLNNSGDIIILYDSSGTIIDQVVYGNWDDGNLSDNAPLAHDPASMARIFNGYNTFNNSNDFAVTIKPTKGLSNIIQTEAEVSLQAKAGFDFSGDIYLSEILPNPTGDDAKNEFIEIYNAGARQVNLTGWSLSNEDGKKINLEKIAASAIIRAGEYLALFRPKTKIVLHNDQGEVKLFQPLADKAWQIVKYKEVKEGFSYNAKNPPDPLYQGGQMNNEWAWSETATPGAVNAFKIVNRPPEVEFSFPENILVGQPVIFDSSDTDWLESDNLKYAWDFGDGFKNILANPEHTFFKAGIYKVSLTVSDGQETAGKENSLKVVNSVSELNGVDEMAALSAGWRIARNDRIVINEIFPNPAGADTGSEWAELKNQSLEKINLMNWRLENGNGKYKFKNDLWLEAESFYLLTNAASKLAFKNTDDVISLYNDLDEMIDRVEYAQAVQGEAYARGQNGKWFWTTKLTPGEENIISVAESRSGIRSNESGIVKNTENYLETELDKAKEMEVGSLVKTWGVVAVEPGILGAQIFYIVGSSTDSQLDGAGSQIYNYKKDFPALKTGDYIEVRGELGQIQGGPRIKTKTKSDIVIKEHQSAPVALALSCDQVNEENIGQLISISGEITDKKSYTLYLDDGSDEILVYFKKTAGIDTKSLRPGQAVSVTGILNKTATGFRLLPRSQDDIDQISQTDELRPQVLGEVAEAQDWVVAERDKKIELFKYLLIIAGGVIIVLAGLFIKEVKKR